MPVREVTATGKGALETKPRPETAANEYRRAPGNIAGSLAAGKRHQQNKDSPPQHTDESSRIDPDSIRACV